MSNRIVMRNVSELKPAPFNPTIRTDAAHIRDLAASMRADGWIDGSVIVITVQDFIADGHRRWTAAQKAGFSQVPCVITDMPLDKAFRLLNSNRAEFSGTQIISAKAAGMKGLPKSPAGEKVRRMMNKYGDEGIAICAELRLSPTAFLWAESVCRYTGLTDASVFNVLRWMSKNKMNKMVRYCMEADYPAGVILSAITEDRKIEFAK